jgi:hypothetical protein
MVFWWFLGPKVEANGVILCVCGCFSFAALKLAW